MKKTTKWFSMFEKGDKVEVLANKTDDFNDFIGTVCGFRGEGIVKVRDYDGDVFCCNESQLEKVKS
jgi:hypothetical protein